MKIVQVRVKSSSKKGNFIQPALDGTLLVHVREPAIDGKANKAVKEMLAGYFDVSKTRVLLVSGQTARVKRFKIDM